MAGARPHRAEPGASSRPTKGGAVRIRIALTTAVAVIAIPVVLFAMFSSPPAASARVTGHEATQPTRGGEDQAQIDVVCRGREGRQDGNLPQRPDGPSEGDLARRPRLHQGGRGAVAPAGGRSGRGRRGSGPRPGGRGFGCGFGCGGGARCGSRRPLQRAPPSRPHGGRRPSARKADATTRTRGTSGSSSGTTSTATRPQAARRCRCSWPGRHRTSEDRPTHRGSATATEASGMHRLPMSRL